MITVLLLIRCLWFIIISRLLGWWEQTFFMQSSQTRSSRAAKAIKGSIVICTQRLAQHIALKGVFQGKYKFSL